MIGKANLHWLARLASDLFYKCDLQQAPTPPFSIPQKLHPPFRGPQARIYQAIDKGMFFSCSFVDHVLPCNSEQPPKRRVLVLVRRILVHMTLNFRLSLVRQWFGPSAFINPAFMELKHSLCHADLESHFYTRWCTQPALSTTLLDYFDLLSLVMSDIKSSLNRFTLQLVRFHAFTNMNFMNCIPCSASFFFPFIHPCS